MSPKARMAILSIAVVSIAAVSVYFWKRERPEVRDTGAVALQIEKVAPPTSEPPVAPELRVNQVPVSTPTTVPDSVLPGPRTSLGSEVSTPGSASVPANLPVTPPYSPPPSAPAPVIADEMEIAAIELDQVSLMLRDFRTRMGENPVGTNAEIMKAVMGGNRKNARLGPPENQSLNGNGELLDRWGTPVFFHQLSASSMEVRSAGPDRTLYTEDDVVVK